MQIDTTNKFAVASGDRNSVLVLSPPRRPITKDEALNLAAWIITLSGATREEVEAAISAVEST